MCDFYMVYDDNYFNDNYYINSLYVKTYNYIKYINK